MIKTTVLLISLAACGDGEPVTAAPCSDFTADNWTRIVPEAACTLSIADIDESSAIMISGNTPLILVPSGAVRAPISYEVDAGWTTAADSWTGDDERGALVETVVQGQCAWVRCMR